MGRLRTRDSPAARREARPGDGGFDFAPAEGALWVLGVDDAVSLSLARRRRSFPARAKPPARRVRPDSGRHEARAAVVVGSAQQPVRRLGGNRPVVVWGFGHLA